MNAKSFNWLKEVGYKNANNIPLHYALSRILEEKGPVFYGLSLKQLKMIIYKIQKTGITQLPFKDDDIKNLKIK